MAHATPVPDRRTISQEFRDFFGEMAADRDIRLVFTHRTLREVHKEPVFKTYCKAPDDVVPEGASAWLSFQEVQAGATLAGEIAKQTGRTVQFIHDSEVTGGLEKMDFSAISLGLGFNSFTHRLEILTRKKLFEIVWEASARPECTGITDHFKLPDTGVLKPNGSEDYALIVRYVPELSKDEKTRVFFCCAGRTAQGTAAAGRFLAFKWTSILELYKQENRDLCRDSVAVVIEHPYISRQDEDSAGRIAELNGLPRVFWYRSHPSPFVDVTVVGKATSLPRDAKETHSSTISVERDKMPPSSTISSTSETKNFFISYSHQDTAWAEWIAWHLERSGYSTVIQAWDFKAGSNFVLEMDEGLQQAQQVIAILSPHYFASQFTPTEWAAKFARDPRGSPIIPIRVQQVPLAGLLAPIVYIDLFDKDETSATHELLAKIKQQRAKPLRAPAFPGAFRPEFPGVSHNTKVEQRTTAPLLSESKDGSDNLLSAGRLESETFLEHGFHLMAKSYLDVQMYREKWDKNEPIQSVTMVHVSGGVFRQQRTRWQIECAKKRWPENLPIGGDVKAETRDEMNRRIKIELEGEEPWPDTLRKLRVFIGNENKFKRWKKANNRLMETQDASRVFWIGYMRKLKEKYGALYYGHNQQFVAELYEIERSDFYAHLFNTKSAGHIVGCNLFNDWDCPTAYQVLWPKSQDKPKAFSSIERAIEDIRKDSSICRPIKL